MHYTLKMDANITPLAVSDDGTIVTVPLPDGPSKFHAIWLQDNAQDETAISKSSGQKLLTLHQQPQNPRIRSANLNRGVVSVYMENASSKQYDFELDWLHKYRYDRPQQSSLGWIDDSAQLWGAALSSDFPSADYQTISNDKASLLAWLKLIRRFGFAHLTNVGTRPGELLNVAKLFGHTRETNYGQVFDVKTQVNADNLAYTSLGLQAHTDNPYRHPVPTMQILSCLENSTSGGNSIVVDGFHAARTLSQENPMYFDLLHRYCVRFQYNGSNDVRLSAKKPVLEVAPDGELIAIRFNNRSIAPIRDVPFSQMHNFYAALRHLNEIIERPDVRVEFQLRPGELFIVNNTRVLHARTSFSAKGKRHLQGCYPDIDGLLSTITALEEKYDTASP